MKLSKSTSRSFSPLIPLAACLVCLTLLPAVPLRGQGSDTPQATAASSEEPRDDQFRVDVNVVTLRFSVQSSQGSFINDLDQDQFQVFEEGEPREIVFFEKPRNAGGVSGPLWLAFLLDVSGSTFATRSEEILAARSFLDSLTSVTRVGVFGFTDVLIPFQEFTSDRRMALDAFNSAQRHLGKTSIYASLNTLMNQMNQQAPADVRKVIIVLSDGIDENHRLSAQTIASARLMGINIYTVWIPSAAQLYIGSEDDGSDRSNPSGLDAGKSKLQEQKAAFARLSSATGGRHFGGFETILDLDNVMAQIHDEILGNLYTVGYFTEDPQLYAWERKIRVASTRSGVRISELFKKVPNQNDTKRKFLAALFDNEAISGLTESVRSFQEIGAQIDLLKSRREGGQIGLPFRIKISPFTLEIKSNGIFTHFGIIGVLSDLQGNEKVRLREIFRASLSRKEIAQGKAIMYNNKLLAPPGAYQLKVALVEIPTWRMTVFEGRVRINDPE